RMIRGGKGLGLLEVGIRISNGRGGQARPPAQTAGKTDPDGPLPQAARPTRHAATPVALSTRGLAWREGSESDQAGMAPAEERRLLPPLRLRGPANSSGAFPRSSEAPAHGATAHHRPTPPPSTVRRSPAPAPARPSARQPVHSAATHRRRWLPATRSYRSCCSPAPCSGGTDVPHRPASGRRSFLSPRIQRLQPIKHGTVRLQGHG